LTRKSFLRSVFTAGVGSLVLNQSFASEESASSLAHAKLPPYLVAGDTIAITCPAGAVDLSKLQCCCTTMEKWGLNVSFGKTVGKHWQRFGGTDRERLEDFQQLLDDKNVKAILFGRGGYGTMRIIDQLNWEQFKKHPKWLVGYSDLTVVHLHVHSNLNICTLHADMSNGFSDDANDPSAVSLRQALFGEKLEYTVKGHQKNKTGKAAGKLVGGNLTIVNACAASNSDISTKGKILFIEDVSEYKYNIDRMMMTLKRSGKLDKLAGLVVGEFTATKTDEEGQFDVAVEDIIFEKVKEYNYPVCFHFPAGHIAANRALKMGCNVELTVDSNTVTLTELV
jgi:muramoyltetrapeptide carboxypeptidase